jgi:hypothetical protein
MRLRFIPTLFILVLLSTVAVAQPADTAQVLTADQYLSWVASYHPVARQGRLLNVQAEALERLARGGFDPKLYGDWDQKNFKESEYFAFGEAGVKIPTWYGIELKGAYAVADVDALYQNAERTVPDIGQAVLGIKVPLGRNSSSMSAGLPWNKLKSWRMPTGLSSRGWSTIYCWKPRRLTGSGAWLSIN